MPSPVYLPLKSVNSLLLQVKAEWAFKVYDYNEDEKIDGEDIKRVVMDIIGRNRSEINFFSLKKFETFTNFSLLFTVDLLSVE